MPSRGDSKQDRARRSLQGKQRRTSFQCASAAVWKGSRRMVPWLKDTTGMNSRVARPISQAELRSEEGMQPECSHPAPLPAAAPSTVARFALQPITDVVHLIHWAINCEGHSWDGRGAKSSIQVLTAPASDRDERTRHSSSEGRKASL